MPKLSSFVSTPVSSPAISPPKLSSFVSGTSVEEEVAAVPSTQKRRKKPVEEPPKPRSWSEIIGAAPEEELSDLGSFLKSPPKEQAKRVNPFYQAGESAYAFLKGAHQYGQHLKDPAIPAPTIGETAMGILHPLMPPGVETGVTYPAGALRGWAEGKDPWEAGRKSALIAGKPGDYTGEGGITYKRLASENAERFIEKHQIAGPYAQQIRWQAQNVGSVANFMLDPLNWVDAAAIKLSGLPRTITEAIASKATIVPPGGKFDMAKGIKARTSDAVIPDIEGVMPPAGYEIGEASFVPPRPPPEPATISGIPPRPEAIKPQLVGKAREKPPVPPPPPPPPPPIPKKRMGEAIPILGEQPKPELILPEKPAPPELILPGKMQKVEKYYDTFDEAQKAGVEAPQYNFAKKKWGVAPKEPKAPVGLKKAAVEVTEKPPTIEPSPPPKRRLLDLLKEEEPAEVKAPEPPPLPKKADIPEPPPIAPKAETTATKGAKEPWEMSKKEYDDFELKYDAKYKKDALAKKRKSTSEIESSLKEFDENKNRNVIRGGDEEQYFSINKGKGKKYSITENIPNRTGFYKAPSSLSNATPNQVHKWINERIKIKNEQGTAYPFDPETLHSDFVESAIKQGKPVPPEVLADYPDLVAKYGKAATPAAPKAEVVPPPELPKAVPKGKAKAETPATKEPWEMTKEERLEKHGSESLPSAIMDKYPLHKYENATMEELGALPQIVKTQWNESVITNLNKKPSDKYWRRWRTRIDDVFARQKAEEIVPPREAAPPPKPPEAVPKAGTIEDVAGGLKAISEGKPEALTTRNMASLEKKGLVSKGALTPKGEEFLNVGKPAPPVKETPTAKQAIAEAKNAMKASRPSKAKEAVDAAIDAVVEPFARNMGMGAVTRPSSLIRSSIKKFIKEIIRRHKAEEVLIRFSPVKIMESLVEKTATAAGKDGKAYGKWVNKNFTYEAGRPAKFIERLEDALNQIGRKQDLAAKIAEELAGTKGKWWQGTIAYPREAQLRLGQAIKGEVPMRPWYKPAETARKIIDAWGDDARRMELLSDETFFANQGKYMKRMYRTHEYMKMQRKQIERLLKNPDIPADIRAVLGKAALAKKPGEFMRKNIKMDLTSFMKRKNIPKAIRQEMGEIMEPAYPVAKGLMQVGKDVELAKLFASVDQHPTWSIKPGRKMLETIEDYGAGLTPEDIKQLNQMASGTNYAKKTIEAIEANPAISQEVKNAIDLLRYPAQLEKMGYRLIEGKKFGRLNGSYVLESIYDNIQETVKVLNGVERFYNLALGSWKSGKVIWNFASQARNWTSNQILMDLKGLPIYRRDIRIAARDAWKRGDPIIKEIEGSSLLRGNFNRVEIQQFLDNFADKDGALAGFLKGIEKTAKFPARLYERIESGDKIALYYWFRKTKGLSQKAALKEVESGLFDYSKVPNFIKAIRKSPIGSPFITWTYKALPAVYKTALNANPIVAMRFWKYPLAFAMLEEVSRNLLNIDKAEEKKAKPAYMKSLLPGSYLLMPWKDEFGRAQYLNLAYILPWGDIGEIGGGETSGISIPAVLTPSNPFFRVFAEQMANRNFFTTRDIRSETQWGYQRIQSSLDHIYKQMLPSFAPEVPGVVKGGYSWEKTKSAILKKTDYMGRERSLSMVLLDTLLGVKLQPIDFKEQARFSEKDKDYLLRELGFEKSKVKRKMGKGQISRAEGQKYLIDINNKIRWVKNTGRSPSSVFTPREPGEVRLAPSLPSPPARSFGGIPPPPRLR